MRLAANLVLIAVMTGAHAGASGTLTIVAPAAPGGGWDQTARVLQQVFAQVEPGTTVQVENVPGAAGTIGLARFVTAERGNAHALLVTGLVMVSAILTNEAPVTLSEATPIARLTGEYEAIVVPADSKWRTLDDLMAAFTNAPESVSWGGGSAGGTDDLLVRLVAAEAGVAPNRANYIAFPGGGAALAALLGGQVTAGVSGYGEFAGQIASGTLRILAISSPARVPGIDAPTLRERGINLDLANWRALVAPPGLTDVERAALTARIERVATSAEWKAVLHRNGWADLLLSGPAFRQFLIAEQQRVEQVLRGLAAANGASRRTSALRLTPMTMPWLALAGLALLSMIVVARAFRIGGQDARPSPHFPNRGAVGLLAGLLLLYAIAMPTIGFIPMSTALFVLAARLLGSRRWIRDTCLGVGATSVCFVTFTRGLGLELPVDLLTRWLTT